MAKYGEAQGQPATGSDGETLKTIARLIRDGAPALVRPIDRDAPSPSTESNTLPQRLLDAIPLGVALTEGHDSLLVNNAFALAFGYRQASEMTGGVAGVFPKQGELFEFAANGTVQGHRRIQLTGRSRSGRSLDMSVEIHDLGGTPQAPLQLIVLLPSEMPAQQAVHATPVAISEKKPLDSEAARPSVQERIGEASEDRADFLAKVSHEVRTPLNSIIGFSELMKEERLGPIGNDRYRSYIRDIHESGLYALSLINDLLDISKIASGNFEINFTSVDLDELVTECLHVMQPQAQKERVILRMAATGGLPRVLADGRAMKQVLLNLLSNSIKFTEAGGQVIVSTATSDDGAVRLRVRDTGIGMTGSEIEQAMQPFRQLDTSPRKQVGTGLGLPLTKALVEANRATFRLKSTSGSGTTIDILFAADRTVAPGTGAAAG
ncbi:MAG: HAMP domain-containing sensor histidine kinase [Pseudomonadota bacterium]|nr:HAMP domain-containing sensor histidine kinase [Pseudomonadota bacterium]